MRAMEHKTKRGRRFERRLAERKERAADEKTVVMALTEVRDLAERAENRRQDAYFLIMTVICEMKETSARVSGRDVERWCHTLRNALRHMNE